MIDDGFASFPFSSSPLLTNLSLSFKEHKIQTADELAHLQASHTSTQLSLASHISKINSKLETLNTSITEKDGKESVELVKMHNSVTALVQLLSVMPSQHKEQIVFKLSMVGTAITSSKSSLETFRSKLKSLAATTTQLSSYHHSMETDISSAKCLDTDEGVQLHQNLQDNLSHQLETIQQYVDSLPVHTCGGT